MINHEGIKEHNVFGKGKTSYVVRVSGEGVRMDIVINRESTWKDM